MIVAARRSGIRGGFAGRYAAVGRILKRAGWARLALTAAWNTYAPGAAGLRRAGPRDTLHAMTDLAYVWYVNNIWN